MQMLMPCHEDLVIKKIAVTCSRTEQKCQLEMESRDKSPGNSDININDNMGDNSTYVDQMLIEENAVVYVTTRSGKRLDKSTSMSNHRLPENRRSVGPDRQKCSRTDDFKIYIGPNVR